MLERVQLQDDSSGGMVFRIMRQVAILRNDVKLLQ